MHGSGRLLTGPGWRNGRRSWLKPGGRKACGFESLPRYHLEAQKCQTEANPRLSARIERP